MIDKKAFAALRAQFEQFDALREELIKQSRDVLKNSKAAIYATHRNDFKAAELLLADARKVMKRLELLIKKDMHLAQVGAWGEALEEFVLPPRKKFLLRMSLVLMQTCTFQECVILWGN